MLKQKKPELCYCSDCAKAKMIQYGFNPVLAECDDGTRNIASYPVTCNRHEDFIDKPGKRVFRCIENLPKKIGI